MSGTRHHFIPQFIQRGFTARTTSKGEYVFVLPRDRPGYETSIGNVGVEGHFYTSEAAPHVDDTITRAESALASLASTLRSGETGDVPAQGAAELISHLEVRTRHLRSNVASMGHRLVERVRAFAADQKAVERLVLRNLARNSSWLVEQVQQGLQKDGLDGLVSADWIRAQLPLFVATKLPEIARNAGALFVDGLAQSRPMLETAARNAQLRVLDQGLSPAPKTDEYRQLLFSVQSTPRELVLGDSMVLFEVAAERSFTPFRSGDDQLLAAYLPLSPNRVLVGRTCGHDPALDDLPEAIAKVSLEFVVAGSRSAAVLTLQPLIGQMADLVDDETLDALFLEVFTKAQLPRW
jgi:hypothetical protein